jgi:hypothetical protein
MNRFTKHGMEYVANIRNFNIFLANADDSALVKMKKAEIKSLSERKMEDPSHK